jgi:tRNA threonylcarbamoyladenosine biosynthesis protein TsaB
LTEALLLAVDTCGTVGSIALGRVADGQVELLGERSVPGGELSVSLVQAISDLLASAGAKIGDLAGLVAVAGPGSFTGIRIGLAAVKGFAEAAALPVVTLSRLALLAETAKTPTVVLDAHRGQMYCGMYAAGELAREMLLTAGEVNAMGGLPGPVGVCEEAVAQALEELRGGAELLPSDLHHSDMDPSLGGTYIKRVVVPSAWDALRFAFPRWLAGDFVDVASLDGYYLRGADAKIAVRD